VQAAPWSYEPLAQDPDGDGGSDSQVITVNVNSADTDGDGMSDDWKLDNGPGPNDPTDAWFDAEGDGLLNLDELAAEDLPHRQRS
jgi:hypothetical protein